MTFSAEQTAELGAPLNRAVVKKNPRGYDYVEAWHAIAEANRIFGFDGWTRETVLLTETNRDLVELSGSNGPYKQWRIGYIAKVRVTAGGVVREGTGYGSGMGKPEALGDAIEGAVKEAESDAMKRALMTFGNPFGLALYDKAKANVIDAFDTPPAPMASETRTVPPPPSKASLKRSGIFETMRDEVDACDSIEALEAWNLRRGPDIKALPKDWYDALGDRFQVRREELLAPKPPEAEEMDEAFRGAVGPGERDQGRVAAGGSQVAA